MTLVNIGGIDRYLLLERLWDTQKEGTSTVNVFQIEEAMRGVRRDGYVTEVCGRPIHAWLFDMDTYELDATQYDNIAGSGTFSRVVAALRIR